jgi:hypothetical protein
MRLCDISAYVVHETEKAILVRNIKGDKVWLPKSAIELEYEENIVGNEIGITLSQNLAADKELI